MRDLSNVVGTFVFIVCVFFIGARLLGSLAKKPAMTVKRWYEHDGSVDFVCETCRVEGTRPFISLRTEAKDPTVSDYDGLLVSVEVEHSLTGCRGSVVSAGGFRHRTVEHVEGG